MKTIVPKLILLALLTVVPLSAAAQTKLFQSVADRYPQVEWVYISPAMMRMTGGTAKAYAGQYAGTIKQLKMLEVIELDSGDAMQIKSVSQMCQDIIKKLNLELLLDSREDGEISRIYADTDGEKPASVMLIESQEAGEYSLVCLQGEFVF